MDASVPINYLLGQSYAGYHQQLLRDEPSSSSPKLHESPAFKRVNLSRREREALAVRSLIMQDGTSPMRLNGATQQIFDDIMDRWEKAGRRSMAGKERQGECENQRGRAENDHLSSKAPFLSVEAQQKPVHQQTVEDALLLREKHPEAARRKWLQEHAARVVAAQATFLELVRQEQAEYERQKTSEIKRVSNAQKLEGLRIRYMYDNALRSSEACTEYTTLSAMRDREEREERLQEYRQAQMDERASRVKKVQQQRIHSQNLCKTRKQLASKGLKKSHIAQLVRCSLNTAVGAHTCESLHDTGAGFIRPARMVVMTPSIDMPNNTALKPRPPASDLPDTAKHDVTVLGGGFRTRPQTQQKDGKAVAADGEAARSLGDTEMHVNGQEYILGRPGQGQSASGVNSDSCITSLMSDNLLESRSKSSLFSRGSELATNDLVTLLSAAKDLAPRVPVPESYTCSPRR